MENTRVVLTADVIIEMPDKGIVLVKRGNDPFKGRWALPGGKMDDDETIELTAIREAKEETGLDIKPERVLNVYSDPDRDPRGRYVSVTFICSCLGGTLKAGSDAKEYMVTDKPLEFDLAFDHSRIIADYLSAPM